MQPDDPATAPAPAPLAVRDCRQLCSWRATRAGAVGGTSLFACAGCGSQWRPGAGWTPADRDGSVPREVRAALRAWRERSG